MEISLLLSVFAVTILVLSFVFCSNILDMTFTLYQEEGG